MFFKSIAAFFVGVFVTVGGWFGHPKQMPMSQQPIASTTSVPTPDISGWKTFRSDTYGFELKYPQDLAAAFESTTTDDQVALFHVYDPKFDSTGKVGAEIRDEFSEVIFTVYPYTSESFAKRMNDGISLGTRNGSKDSIETIKSPSGDIKIHFLQSGLVGPYAESYFHNDKYTFQVDAIAHTDLAEGILSTLQFTVPIDSTWQTYKNNEFSIKLPKNWIINTTDEQNGFWDFSTVSNKDWIHGIGTPVRGPWVEIVKLKQACDGSSVTKFDHLIPPEELDKYFPDLLGRSVCKGSFGINLNLFADDAQLVADEQLLDIIAGTITLTR